MTEEAGTALTEGCFSFNSCNWERRAYRSGAQAQRSCSSGELGPGHTRSASRAVLRPACPAAGLFRNTLCVSEMFPVFILNSGVAGRLRTQLERSVCRRSWAARGTRLTVFSTLKLIAWHLSSLVRSHGEHPRLMFSTAFQGFVRHCGDVF